MPHHGLGVIAELAQTVKGPHMHGAFTQAYADENSLFFWETSAKTNVNVAEVFNDIADRLPRAAAAAAPQQPTGGITLTEPAPEQKKKSSCCSTA